MNHEWRPNRSSVVPIYKQIVRHFEEKINNKEFLPCSKLPSERELAKKYGVNRSTIATAYGELFASNLVTTKKGKGTLVSSIRADAIGGRPPNWNRLLKAGTLSLNSEIIQRISKEKDRAGMLDLATGQLSPELWPNQEFEYILKNRRFDQSLGYDEVQGNRKLRQTIAKHLAETRKIHSNPSSLLITSGVQQAVHLIIQCLLKPGDAVAIENPSYAYTFPIFKSLGIKTILLEVDKDGINPNDLETAYQRHRFRFVFLGSSYQNPTGTVLQEIKRRKILQFSSKYGIPIIEDDPYSLLTFENNAPLPLKSSDGLGNVIYISSLSKTVSPGMRVGWLVAPKFIVDRLADARQQIDFGSSILSEWMAKEFLQSSFFHCHLLRLKNKLKERRDLLIQSLDQHLSGRIGYEIPNGGIHIWVKLRDLEDEGKLFYSSLQKGALFMPGSVLGTKPGYARLTYSRIDMQSIDEAIKRFAEAVLEQDSTRVR